MWSNPMRRDAMSRARDTGNAATSGIITLIQETEEDVQPGFLTYLPVYEQDQALDSVADRRQFLLGWIFAPFRAHDLMSHILKRRDFNVNVEIFDGEQITPLSLMYDSNGVFHSDPENYQPDLAKQQSIQLQGRQWTFYFETPPDFLEGFDQKQPLYIAVAGTSVDFLLFFVIYSLYFINKKMVDTANEKMIVFEQAPNALIMVDTDGTIVLTNHQYDRLFGYEKTELIVQVIEILLQDR
jgi:CHASE1-domain containing sensor protein